MPRTARLDTPGLLHHVMIRGIERRKIFRDDKDREEFIERPSVLLLETEPSAMWAFLSKRTKDIEARKLRSGEARNLDNLTAYG